ncbi:MAG: RIP metalloprotease RseP [Methylococcales bacterium]|nr:RIP metalloprotease RseP [Methylococcales bacterium]MBT7409295.1 RIP metalloprotease RseP [Methylococcales bacterium]
MDIIVTLISFLVALAILISVHEYGHYWVAKKSGVKVLTFSLGFGKPLWKTIINGDDKTEFVISAIPLGGYVKMLDEREGDVAENESHRAFNRQSLLKRCLIVSAGPVYNLVFAVMIYWLVFMIGVTGSRPIIGDVTPNSPAAQAQMQSGDEIISIGQRQTSTWQDTMFALLSEASAEEKNISLKVKRMDDSIKAIRLDLSGIINSIKAETLLEELGIEIFQAELPPIIGNVLENNPASIAGFKVMDKVISSNGEKIATWSDWVKHIQSHAEEKLSIIIERDGAVMTLTLVPKKIKSGNKTIGRIGAGVYIPEGLIDSYRAVVSYSPLEALIVALNKTKDMSILMLRIMKKMLFGTASIDNLSGPISIAQYAGKTALIGLIPFLMFLAAVSVSLGVLNLLPIPVLDGGHLFFYLVEFIKGSPVSENAQIMGQKVGMVLLLLLMSVAIFKDFERLIG